MSQTGRPRWDIMSHTGCPILDVLIRTSHPGHNGMSSSRRPRRDVPSRSSCPGRDVPSGTLCPGWNVLIRMSRIGRMPRLGRPIWDIICPILRLPLRNIYIKVTGRKNIIKDIEEIFGHMVASSDSMILYGKISRIGIFFVFNSISVSADCRGSGYSDILWAADRFVYFTNNSGIYYEDKKPKSTIFCPGGCH